MSHACKCGTPLQDRRATFCPSCRGTRVKQQELARKNVHLAEISDIDWNYVGLAVRMRLEEIRANDPRVDALVQEIALEQAGCPPSVIPYAAKGRVLRPENFHRIAAWLGREPEAFNKSEAVARAAVKLRGTA